jgi:hypothetical protein
MSRMLNEFQPGHNSTWPKRPERKYTMTVETEITADHISGGSENIRMASDFGAQRRIILGCDPSIAVEVRS